MKQPVPGKRFPLTNPEGLDFPETPVWLSLAAHLGLCADPSQVCEVHKHGVRWGLWWRF